MAASQCRRKYHSMHRSNDRGISAMNTLSGIVSRMPIGLQRPFPLGRLKGAVMSQNKTRICEIITTSTPCLISANDLVCGLMVSFVTGFTLQSLEPYNARGRQRHATNGGNIASGWSFINEKVACQYPLLFLRGRCAPHFCLFVFAA
jgi:hypothetical protein